MKIFSLFLILLFVQSLKMNSNEFYECINPERTVTSSSECTSIEIPEKEGYTCCSIKMIFNGNYSYNCFALEKEYTESKAILDEYISNRNLGFIFGAFGGEIEIECGGETKSTQNYEKVSEEFTNCYNNHLSGVNNENECHIYNIPEKEGSNCCYLETKQKDNTGNITSDKRCYIIQDSYFTNEKNLSNYLLDKTNKKSLNEIKNINATINCKNHDIFYFNSKFDDNEQNTHNNDNTPKDDSDAPKSSSLTESNNTNINNDNNSKKKGKNRGVIAAIIVVVVVILVASVIVIFYFLKIRKGKKQESESINNINKLQDKKDSNIPNNFNNNDNNINKDNKAS